MTRRQVAKMLAIPLGFGRLTAQTPPEIAELFGDLAAALSNGRAADFMRYFDASMPGYAELRTLVSALLEQAEVSSSIEFINVEQDQADYSVEVDWLLHLRARSPGEPIDRRRGKLKCRVTRKGRAWKIVSLSPVDFFRPPRY